MYSTSISIVTAIQLSPVEAPTSTFVEGCKQQGFDADGRYVLSETLRSCHNVPENGKCAFIILYVNVLNVMLIL